jgi:predicted DsbA family dithiol-disulfide isomerase
MNVADEQVLGRLWAEAELDGEPAGAGFDDEVQADLDRAAELGLRGVPAFVIDDRHLVSGAQEVDTLVRVLDQIREA